MDEIDKITSQLEQLLGDPLADSVHGAVRIEAASEPVGRARYQTCILDVVTVAVGIPETSVRTEVVTSRRYWPKVGALLPARISRIDPTAVEIDWDALAKA